MSSYITFNIKSSWPFFSYKDDTRPTPTSRYQMETTFYDLCSDFKRLSSFLFQMNKQESLFKHFYYRFRLTVKSFRILVGPKLRGLNIHLWSGPLKLTVCLG